MKGIEETTYAALVVLLGHIHQGVTITQLKNIITALETDENQFTPPEGYYNNLRLIVPTSNNTIEGTISTAPDIIEEYSVDNLDLIEIYDRNGISLNPRDLVHTRNSVIPKLNYVLLVITLYLVKEELKANGVKEHQIVFEVPDHYDNLTKDMDLIHQSPINLDYFDTGFIRDIRIITEKYRHNQYRVNVSQGIAIKIFVMEHWRCYVT